MSDRILVIEDDDSLSALIGDYLSLSGFAFRVAKDGAAGLAAALDGTTDLAILDLMLPGMNGFDVLAGIREKSELPVLILSARREDIDKIRGLGLGADDYMTKPFSPGELIARVKAHLARHRRLTGTEAQKGTKAVELRGLALDAEARRVWVLGSEAELTPKEFDILSLLMHNPNRVFSREELFARIWGEGTYGDDSTVTVHVRKLREKIEAEPSDPKIIETVWGLGYRIRVG